MIIKLLALISLFPSFYVINKILKRKDLTCIDILILFQTLYMAIIPLFSDVELIAYECVRSNLEVQLYIFIVYNVFSWLLVLYDYWGLQKNRGLLSFTQYIRQWVGTKEIKEGTIIVIFFLILLQGYILYNSYERFILLGVGSMESMREMIIATNTPFLMWLNSGSHLIRLYIVFMLTIFSCKYWHNHKIKKEYRILLGFLIILETIIHFLISRTYLFESSAFICIIVYALRKQSFTISRISWIIIFFVFITSVLFPVITGFRAARRYLIAQNMHADNIIEVVIAEYQLMESGKISTIQADNKAERSWGVYQILGKAYDCKYEGNGELTVNAISIGAPKFLLPNKSKTGSQGIMEKTLKSDDVADSILLLSIFENRVFAPVLAFLYYLLIFFTFIGLNYLFQENLNEWLAMPIIICSLFIWLNRIEYSFDGYISSITNLLMWYGIFFIIIRLLLKFDISLYCKNLTINKLKHFKHHVS